MVKKAFYLDYPHIAPKNIVLMRYLENLVNAWPVY
jgi:hypothetical protein